MNRSSFCLIAVICCFLNACKESSDIPPYNCEGASMKVTIDNTASTLRVNNNTLFRVEEDDGGYKLLTMEAISDSLKIVLNLKSGPYSLAGLQNDSIAVDTFLYSKAAGLTDGLIVIGTRQQADGFDFPGTDTAAIILTGINYSRQTVSGAYYFEAANHTIRGKGTFKKVCYLSLP